VTTVEDFDAAARAAQLTAGLEDGPLRDVDEPPADPYADLPPVGVEDEAQDKESAFKRLVDALDAELLNTYSLSQIPRNESLVDGFLYLNTTARVNGASGAMKSFVMLDLAGHVGTGLPWRGRKVKQGAVVYLVAEGAGGFEKRVRAWEQHYNRRMEGVYILPRPVQAKDPEWDVLTAVCKRREAKLIVCDTQARITVGVEENSAKEMGLIIDRVETMRIATGACVVLVHHQGVQGERGRGSTSVKGALQTELRVDRDGKGLMDTRITVISDKQKDDEEAEDVVFALEQQVINGMAKEDGTPMTSVVLVPAETTENAVQPLRLTPAQRKLLWSLEQSESPSTRKEMVDRIAAKYEHGLTRETVSRELNALLKLGLVDRIESRPGMPDTWIPHRSEPVTMEQGSVTEACDG
jgi:AAA domain